MVSNADMADVPELQDVRFARGASRDYHLDTKGDSPADGRALRADT